MIITPGKSKQHLVWGAFPSTATGAVVVTKKDGSLVRVEGAKIRKTFAEYTIPALAESDLPASISLEVDGVVQRSFTVEGPAKAGSSADLDKIVDKSATVIDLGDSQVYGFSLDGMTIDEYNTLSPTLMLHLESWLAENKSNYAADSDTNYEVQQQMIKDFFKFLGREFPLSYAEALNLAFERIGELKLLIDQHQNNLNDFAGRIYALEHPNQSSN